MARGQVGGAARDEIAREALKLLRRLRLSGAYLSAGADGGKKSAYHLRGVNDGIGTSDVVFRAVLVNAFLSNGWLERLDAKILVADAGLAWLRRMDAGQEPFREQHQLRGQELREVSPGVHRPVSVNFGESPLGWLAKRKDGKGNALITSFQFEAGERLAREYWLAQLSPRVTADWSGVSSAKRSRRAAPSNNADASLTSLAAKERVHKALSCVGPELSGILIDVCCNSCGLEAAEKDHGWP